MTSEIDEAIFLADRLVILSNKPAEVRAVIDIELPRPRDFKMLSSPEAYRYKSQAMEILHEEGHEELCRHRKYEWLYGSLCTTRRLNVGKKPVEMGILEILSSRTVIVTLAIIGGLIAMLGTYLMRDGSKDARTDGEIDIAQWLHPFLGQRRGIYRCRFPRGLTDCHFNWNRTHDLKPVT